jgi:hypothetical protein
MNRLLDLRPKQWNLMILPRPNTDNLLAAMAHLAEHIPVTVLDCGRQFDSSVIARAAHGRKEIIDRIKIQRAFICTEAVKLIEQLPTRNTPVVILDFLSTFYDENVKIAMRKFLLERSLQHFQRLSRGAGLVVMVHPPPASSDPLYLFHRLQSCASQVSRYETPASDSRQLSFL